MKKSLILDRLKYYTPRKMNWIDVWIDEPYMNIQLYQNIQTRYIIEKLDDLQQKHKHIVDVYVIRLLQKYNDVLINKHGVEGYIQGLYNLLGWYDYVKTDLGTLRRRIPKQLRKKIETKNEKKIETI